MSAPLAHVSGLGLTFEGQREPTLDGLEFEILTGETLCLLGPSGCGKSTLLRLIAGLETPSCGDIAWAGGQRPDIGFVFQEPNLMPWADLFANVYLPLRLAGVGRREAAPKVEAALCAVGLADRAKALPRQLSGGMKMRASIARALVDEPRLLLLDEPFAALDEITRWQLNDLLVDLAATRGATIVFVTHSVFESAFLADRVAIMAARPGRIVELFPIARGAERRRDGEVFAQNCEKIGAALRAAMAASGRAAE